ncbi:serine/threonine-protein kinase [Streptomyces roseus]|uniref:serine/threonine-protein kinase n=1 Tax=Streptomyces roseus TaxID=66430 RepID=UPI00131C1D78|nr:serine/threonine-protein kinase [Streptomyces roseus]
MSREGYSGRMVAGRYRLVSKLGAGGFGQVWKAWDENLRVDVAVKEVSLPQAGSAGERAERVARAEREARHAAQLRTHPHVVAVHDVVVENGVPWMVMELVAGRSLEQEIRNSGRMPVAKVRRIAVAILEALRAAHAAGIVHRDVKPANVLLADDGRVLLADFGIAVHAADTKLTGTGMVIGSVEYIAPERAEGDDGHSASDLFSLGVTLYQAIEGTSPFRRSSASASLRAVLAHEPPPPQHAGPLAGLITRLLDKDPAKRPTAETALTMLGAGMTETTVTEGSSEVEPQTRQDVAALVVGSLSLLAGVALSIGLRFPNASDKADPTMTLIPLVTLLGFVWGLVWWGSSMLLGSAVDRFAKRLQQSSILFSLVALVNIMHWATLTARPL